MASSTSTQQGMLQEGSSGEGEKGACTQGQGQGQATTGSTIARDVTSSATSAPKHAGSGASSAAGSSAVEEGCPDAAEHERRLPTPIEAHTEYVPGMSFFPTAAAAGGVSDAQDAQAEEEGLYAAIEAEGVARSHRLGLQAHE